MSNAAPEPDLILGRYRPLRPLGAGGMGSVWLARDEGTGLDVALKIVAREGKSGSRAEREARAAASLRHPRCQRIISLARDPSHVYIAYEYIPGRTLREAMRAGELDDRAAIEVAAQICEALAHAHAKGIVHRDVKPSNVMLAEHGDGGVDVRLVDFGLAQMAEFDTLTALGDIPGTLAYISPERLHGRPATPAADVWAVGVVLWEALAGQHPFWGGDLAETSRSIQRGAPPLRTLRPDLPDRLLRIVDSVLLGNPQRRPTAAGLAQELRGLPGRRRKKSGGAGRSVPRPRPSVATHAQLARERLLPGALAGIAAGWVASSLAFYPSGWPLGLAAVGAGLGFAAPRAGLAFALATAFFPLANISLGLALLFAAAAVGWLVLTWRDPRGALLLTVGPLLAPLGALALLPVAVQAARGRMLRAVQAGSAVLLAALVAGLRHARLPFDGSAPPLGLGIAGSVHPTAVASAFLSQLQSHPVLVVEAAILAGAAAVLPSVRGRGPWPAALFGAALFAGTALAAPAADVLPLALVSWLVAGGLALEAHAGGPAEAKPTSSRKPKPRL
ncbi:MAG TPA: serine/threonine-protein kinase [Gaiellaceae bacterium]|nr:serine/threonine-protein kinase [Gaiellaceae bacterium]